MQLGAPAVELVGAALDVAARDEAVDDAGRAAVETSSRRATSAGPICSRLRCSSVTSSDSLSPARRDTTWLTRLPAATRSRSASSVGGCAGRSSPRAHPGRGRDSVLVVRHGRPTSVVVSACPR